MSLIEQPVVLLVQLDGIAYFTGRLVEDGHQVVIDHATWWRDTGRHSAFMAGAPVSPECEAYPPEVQVRVDRDHVRAIIGPWPGDLAGGTR